MNRKSQTDLFEDIIKKQKEILFRKSEDYANADDVLLNFKQMSELGKNSNLASMTPTQVAFWYASVKAQRLGNLLKSNKTPSNEALEDSFIDMMNYVFLAYCNNEDNKVI